MSQHFGLYPTDGYVKIFRHHTNGGYWSNANDWEEVRRSNELNPDSDKYSRLHLLHDGFKINGEYIFKMVMDSYTNIWAQRISPLDDAPTATTVTGYRAISVGTTGNNWGGLSRGDGGSAFIDGNPNNTNWYYPLGPTNSWNGGLPQYDSTGHPLVELYVKIR